MLKIEVIKFEAQDVITASVAAPTAPKCICSDDTWYHGAGYLIQGTNDLTTEDHTRGTIKCYADSHPNCYKSVIIN